VPGMHRDGHAAPGRGARPRRRLLVRAAVAALVVLALSSSAADWWQSYPLG
jgi:hypothetical protein